MGKKIIVLCLDVIMIAFFPRNILRSSLFARKACVNTERVPPGHPIMLLKSNKFNMATISVKRSIGATPWHGSNPDSFFFSNFSLSFLNKCLTWLNSNKDNNSRHTLSHLLQCRECHRLIHNPSFPNQLQLKCLVPLLA